MQNRSDIFSTITLICAVTYLSITPSFADQPPPRCLQRYYNCMSADKGSGAANKNIGIRAQCKNQYDSCLKGVTIR